MEMKREPTHEAKLEMWSGGLYALGLPLPVGATSPTYFKSLRHHWIHNHAFGWAQVFVLVAIMGASFIWMRVSGTGYGSRASRRHSRMDWLGNFDPCGCSGRKSLET